MNNKRGYLIARVNITDPVRYARYMEATPAAIAKHGGRFFVRGGEKVTLEGPVESRRLVVIEFPSLAQARAFYHSGDYARARALREGAAEGEFIAVEGA